MQPVRSWIKYCLREFADSYLQAVILAAFINLLRSRRQWHWCYIRRTDDILKYLGEHKPDGQFLCGFSMETENMIGNSRVKLTRKNLDMVAANNVKMAGAGFQGDTNVLTLITQDEEVSLPLMSKEDAAGKILDKILLERVRG